MTIPWVFFVVSLVGAAFTLNAHRSIRRSPLIVPSFFAGWLTSELPLHHLGWQLVATLAFAAGGALEAWPGWIGLTLTLGSWAGLLALLGPAERARPAMAEAVAAATGATTQQGRVPLRIPLMPFSFKDPDVTRSSDLPYVEDGGKRQRLDIHRLGTGVENAPVLLQIHGGAWVIGEKQQQGLPLMTELARRGWVCVAINYRLSPRHRFPIHLEDCKRALAWIRSNIRTFGGDPDFVAVTGGSAGGHLSSLVALTANDRRYQPGFEDVDTRVSACVPFYGIYDFTDDGDLQTIGGMRGFLERSVMQCSFEDSPERWREASPLYRVHADAPPFLVVHGTHDSLARVEGARAFVRSLREHSKSGVGYAELPGGQHAFDIFHTLRCHHAVEGVAAFLSEVHAEHRSHRRGGGVAATADGSRD